MFSGCGGPRLARHRRRPGRPVRVVPPDPARAGARRPRRRRGTGRRLAAPVGLADHARRARRRGAARLGVPRDPAGRANDVVPAYFAAYERTHDLPVLRPVRVDDVRDEGGLLVVRAGERTLDEPHPRERDRDVVASVRAALPGHGDVPRRAAAHGRLPGAGALPRSAHRRRGRRRLRRPVPRGAGAGRPRRSGSPAASRSGGPTTSRPRPAARPSPWSSSGYAAGCRRRASSA